MDVILEAMRPVTVATHTRNAMAWLTGKRHANPNPNPRPNPSPNPNPNPRPNPSPNPSPDPSPNTLTRPRPVFDAETGEIKGIGGAIMKNPDGTPMKNPDG